MPLNTDLNIKEKEKEKKAPALLDKVAKVHALCANTIALSKRGVPSSRINERINQLQEFIVALEMFELEIKNCESIESIESLESIELRRQVKYLKNAIRIAFKSIKKCEKAIAQRNILRSARDIRASKTLADKEITLMTAGFKLLLSRRDKTKVIKAPIAARTSSTKVVKQKIAKTSIEIDALDSALRENQNWIQNAPEFKALHDRLIVDSHALDYLREENSSSTFQVAEEDLLEKLKALKAPEEITLESLQEQKEKKEQHIEIAVEAEAEVESVKNVKSVEIKKEFMPLPEFPPLPALFSTPQKTVKLNFNQDIKNVESVESVEIARIKPRKSRLKEEPFDQVASDKMRAEMFAERALAQLEKEKI